MSATAAAIAFGRNAGGREKGASHRLTGKHQLENLPLLAGLGKIHDQRNVGKIAMLLQRQLHQDVDLLFIEPLFVGCDHTRP